MNLASASRPSPARQRWATLLVVCLAQLIGLLLALALLRPRNPRPSLQLADASLRDGTLNDLEMERQAA